MAEELYYNDNFFEAVDLNKIIFCLIEEKQTNSYNEEEISDINQVITQLKECRIISYPFKQNQGVVEVARDYSAPIDLPAIVKTVAVIIPQYNLQK